MPDYHEQIAAFEETCRAHGLKITHQRLEIYRALLESTQHPSAETLYKGLVQRIPSLSLDTVYRTLATFEELGLVTRVQTVQSQTRYEAQVMHHHHLICDKCKSIFDFQWQGFDDIGVPEEVSRLGRISSRNVTLKGICNACLGKEETTSR